LDPLSISIALRIDTGSTTCPFEDTVNTCTTMMHLLDKSILSRRDVLTLF
jgi:hypothetical protein